MILTANDVKLLQVDAKTLDDISNILEADGRFHALPGLLRTISSDISIVSSGVKNDIDELHRRLKEDILE